MKSWDAPRDCLEILFFPGPVSPACARGLQQVRLRDRPPCVTFCVALRPSLYLFCLTKFDSIRRGRRTLIDSRFSLKPGPSRSVFIKSDARIGRPHSLPLRRRPILLSKRAACPYPKALAMITIQPGPRAGHSGPRRRTRIEIGSRPTRPRSCTFPARFDADRFSWLFGSASWRLSIDCEVLVPAQYCRRQSR